MDIGGTVRLRFALAGIVAASAFLAACSSGTSCGFGCPPTTGPSTEPSPVSLAGTQTQHFTFYEGNPTVEPPYTQTTQIAQTVTVSPTSLASPFPPGAANDVRFDETDSIDGKQTMASTTDSYEATSGSNVLNYGSIANTTTTGSAQSTMDTIVYDTAQIVDREPPANGATWSNKPGAQWTRVYSGGNTLERTIADDGTYKEAGYTPAPSGTGYIPVTLIELAGGAGSYDGPFYGGPTVVNDFAAPAGKPPTISATYQIQGSAKKPIFTIPAWYASNPILYAERDAIVGNPVLPAGCAATAGSQLHDVVSRISKIDTIIGYTEQSQSDVYENSAGAQCVRFRDTLLNYYDWSAGPTAHILPYASIKGKKISQVLTSELLTLAAPGVSGSALRSRRVVRAAAIPFAAIGALQDRFRLKIEMTKRTLLGPGPGAR
jgi:hypothetical protein